MCVGVFEGKKLIVGMGGILYTHVGIIVPQSEMERNKSCQSIITDRQPDACTVRVLSSVEIHKAL